MAENRILLGNVGLTARGTWSASYSYTDVDGNTVQGYETGDTVVYNNSLYESLQDGNTEEPSGATTAKWRLNVDGSGVAAAVANEQARVTAEAQRQAAEAERQTGYETMKEATEGADKLNVSIDNGVLSVTNRQGETSSVDISSVSEVVTVKVTSSVSGITVAGTKITVYQNNSKTGTSYTLGSDGTTAFNIERGVFYTVEFPDKNGCKSIPSESYTATGGEREIAVKYEAYDENDVEEVTVNVRKRTSGAYSAWEGATVHVKIGTAAATDMTTDSNGQVEFSVQLGQSYIVSMDKDSSGGYYIYKGEYEKNYTAKTTNRVVWMTWYEYRTGVFLVDSNMVEYTAAEWDSAGKTASDAKLIKVATQNLSENGGIVYMDIDGLAAQSYPSKQWATGAMQSTSISGVPNDRKNSNYFNGQASTDIMIAACEDAGAEAPAASYCKEQTLTVGTTALTGYLPACGQWEEVWANRGDVDTLLTKVKGSSVKLLSKYTTNKWTSTQRNASTAMDFSASPGYNSKNANYVCVVFYAY